MKKVTAILMVVVMLSFVTNVFAGGFWYGDGQWWYVDDNGELHEPQSRPLTWNVYLANYNFPENVITDVSDICEQYHGTPVGCFGLTPSAGSNLRSVPNIDGNLIYGKTGQEYNHQTIIRKLHGNVTVYINFRFYDGSGNEWYYATCSDGVMGLLLAKRIMLISAE